MTRDARAMRRLRRSIADVRRRATAIACAGSFALTCAFAFAFTFAAQSHVVVGTKSLHLRVAEADVILRGRVVDPASMFVAEDGKTRRALVVVEVLEALKGEPGAKSVRVAQDGHAVARYDAGDEALFFLKPISRSLELRSLAVPGGATHVSGQEHDDAFVLEGPAGRTLLAATRIFVASEHAETTEERVALIRRATIELLTSGDDRLATSALASLVLAPEAEWITSADLPRLHAAIANPRNAIGLRAGLIDELERRGLIAGDPDRLAILKSAGPGERAAAIRALGPKGGPEVRAYLASLMGTESGATSEVVAEAAIALGASRDPRVLEPLAQALSRPEARVRNAAIRGLGLFGTTRAIEILEAAGASHPDPATRRRAGAEARKKKKIRSRPPEARALGH